MCRFIERTACASQRAMFCTMQVVERVETVHAALALVLAGEG